MNGSAIYVLVIAHPDDESMFFVPTIKALVDRGEQVWLLCLTTGDYDGLGKEREKELIQAGRILGFEKVIIKNDLKDHPKRRWPVDQVSKEIEKVLTQAISGPARSLGRIVLLTFDEMGVSGHVNHIDTFYGVRDLIRKKPTIRCSSSQEIPLEAWQLETERNLFMKYVPVLEWFLLLLSLFTKQTIMLSNGSPHVYYRCQKPAINCQAMATHRSQFVWYRRLFVIFSCYTYVNKLRPIAKPSQV
jgi:N-acetylglucosaminylphosphatidylinositol deacetylase